MRAITMMQAGWRAETQTGESLTFENSKGGYFSTEEAYGLKVMGTTVNGQPLPAGTVIRSLGRNILPFPYSSQYTELSGITFRVNGDGSLTLSGTATATVDFTFGGSTVPAGVYRKTLRYADGTYANLRFISGSTADGTYNESCNYTYRLSKPTTFNRIYLRVSAGQTVNAIVYPQFEWGDTATPFEKGHERIDIAIPCDLYEGDAWYPATGRVVRSGGTEEHYPAQHPYVYPGRVHVFQNTTGEAGILSATMLTKR